jgi:hypothetical protein
MNNKKTAESKGHRAQGMNQYYHLHALMNGGW